MYIKGNELIPDGLSQCWMFDVSVNGTASAKRLIELKQKRVIGDFDIEILKFLFKFDVATVERIARHLGYENEAPIQERLDKMISLHVINAFMLTDGAEVKLRDDAKLFYTLDAGGLVLLKAYSDEDTLNYRLDGVIMTSTKVNKRLMAIDFYFALKDAIGTRLISYLVDPVLACGHTKYVPKAYFTIQTATGKKGYFLEITRFEDFYEADSTKFSEKLTRCDAILNTNAWKKYFDGKAAPTLLIFAQDIETANRCADLAETGGFADGYRVCTLDTLKKGLDSAFMKYTEGKLKLVKSKNFSKTTTAA